MDHSPDEKIIKEFGKKLKKLRLAKKLSLRKFAAVMGVDHRNIDDMEKGLTNPMLTTLRALAEALEVDVCILMS